MTSIDGILPCAKRGGANFLDTVRVDLKTYECPKGYKPCSPYTTPTDTICIEEDADPQEECPLLEIFVWPESLLSELNQTMYEVTDNGFPSPDGTDKSVLVYSRVSSINTLTQSPIISTEINRFLPCTGPENGRLRLTDEETSNVITAFEKEDPIETCPTYDWAIQGQELRYTVLGQIDLYTLQESNGVFDAMEDVLSQELYEEQLQRFDQRKYITMMVMNRKRYAWAIVCEQNPSSKSNHIYETIY